MRVARAPSVIEPLAERVRSSSCTITGILNSRAYCSARRISAADITGLPSSVTQTQPACTNSPISASSAPSSFLVIAPAGKTRQRLAASASWSTKWVMVAESLGGLVFGIATTEVKPPATAARLPVSTVSLPPSPGSRKWT